MNTGITKNGLAKFEERLKKLSNLEFHMNSIVPDDEEYDKER